MADEATSVPAWVRLPDGSQMPFDADRICRSLFAATESLGTPNAFLARELTDAVLHFLAQDGPDGIPTTAQLAEQIEKIVREIGQPALAGRYAERQATAPFAQSVPGQIDIRRDEAPADLTLRTLETYSRHVVFSRDLHAALDEGLLRLTGLAAPDTFTHFLLEARTLGNDSWWLHWDEWKACGSTWIVDSPEWLSLLPADRSPMVRLCERIIALPRAARHAVELHMNVAEPPRWMGSHGLGPLFADAHDPASHSLRFGLQDMIVEQCLATRDVIPTIAWHLNEDSWRDPTRRARLKSLVRHAVLGRPIRFVFDRPNRSVCLAEGMDRKTSGVLCEIGIDLPTFASRSDIAHDGATLLTKLPSLVRMAVSAAKQKQQYLRSLSARSPLVREFLIERAACVITPLGLDAVVRDVTGESMTKSPLSLQFARQVLETMQLALREAAHALSLNLRLDGTLHAAEGRWPTADATVSLRKQLETASHLHACAGSGTMTLLLADETETNTDTLVALLRWAWDSMHVVRLQMQRAGTRLHQPEFQVT